MTAPRQVARIYGLGRAKKLKRHKVIASTKKNLNNFNNNLIHNGGIMRKTDNIKMLSYAVEDLRKIINFFDERNEEIDSINIKTPESKIFIDIDTGCFITTKLNFKDFSTDRTYKIVNSLYGEITMKNFRIMDERTVWNYDDNEDIEEGTG